MPPTDTEIPPPLPDDRSTIVLEAMYAAWNDGTKGWDDEVLGVIRLLAEERRQSAAVREVLRGVLGSEPCRAKGRYHGDECSGGRVRCSNAQFTENCPSCSGTGTRDVIDGCGLVEAVERAVKVDMHELLARVNKTYFEDRNEIKQAAREAIAERDAARAAVETMRERCAVWRENRRSHPYIPDCNCFSCFIAFKDAAAIRALPLEPAAVKEPM